MLVVTNSMSSVDAQKVFKSMFNALLNEDYSISINIDRYQSVLEYAIVKSGFFNRHRCLYASKKFKLEHRESCGMQQ